jgi:hypothetical protein
MPLWWLTISAADVTCGGHVSLTYFRCGQLTAAFQARSSPHSTPSTHALFPTCYDPLMQSQSTHRSGDSSGQENSGMNMFTACASSEWNRLDGCRGEDRAVQNPAAWARRAAARAGQGVPGGGAGKRKEGAAARVQGLPPSDQVSRLGGSCCRLESLPWHGWSAASQRGGRSGNNWLILRC